MEYSREQSRYEKQKEAMKTALTKLNKDTDSKVVSTMVKEKETYDDVKVQGKIMLVRNVVNETIEMINEGDMTFDEGMKDLAGLVVKI